MNFIFWAEKCMFSPFHILCQPLWIKLAPEQTLVILFFFQVHPAQWEKSVTR